MSTAAPTSPETEHVQFFPIREISPAPENDKLYRPIDPDDPEIIALAASIEERGILEPLVVSSDGFIISGHRRYAAAQVADLDEIPCRVVPIAKEDDPDEFFRLLREYNRQRVKGSDEILREELVSANPEESYRLLLEHRREKARVKTESNIDLGEAKCRSRISNARDPFLNAVIKIIDSLADFWPLTDRQIHYQLLNNPPLVHASKPGSQYRNDKKSYAALSDLLIRARLEGAIAWDVIDDPTRPVSVWDCHSSIAPYMRSETDQFLKGYYRNLQQTQPNHIEIIGEKITVQSTIGPVAMEYRIPLTIGRGYSSFPPRRDLVSRFKKSGKEKLILLFLSDLDPDGEEISTSFARSLRDDFGIENIHPIKAGLTAAQVKALNLPPGMEAKKSSSNYAKFESLHGGLAYELEAVAPGELQRLLRETIDSVLDLKAFNAEIDREKEDSAYLDAVRRSMKTTFSTMEGGLK